TLWAATTWLLALELALAERVRRGTSLAFAASALVLGLSRPEGVFLGSFMLLAVVVARGRSDVGPLLVPYLAIFLTLGLGYFVWRWHYFGYPLPNPFYAKGAGVLHWYSFRTAWRDLAR